MDDVNGIKHIISDLELIMIRDQEIPYDKIKKLIQYIDGLEIDKIEAERNSIDEYKEDNYSVNEELINAQENKKRRRKSSK